VTTLPINSGQTRLLLLRGEYRNHRSTWCNGLRDNLGLIETSSDIEVLARTVTDNGGVYFVPAFSGL